MEQLFKITRRKTRTKVKINADHEKYLNNNKIIGKICLELRKIPTKLEHFASQLNVIGTVGTSIGSNEHKLPIPLVTQEATI